MLSKIIKTLLCITAMLYSLFFGFSLYHKVTDYQINNQKISYYNTQEDHNNLDLNNEYIGYLEIPKIALKRGFYDIKSPLNDVNKNIYYLKESYLNDHNSMIILAAHRGNSSVSFFDKLDRLDIGAKITLSIYNETYSYRLSDIYDELKDGDVNIYHNKSRHALILITCNKYKKKYQTIYVSYREDD